MSCSSSRNSVRSCPAQNPLPAPVITTARTSSDAASSSAACNAACIEVVNALYESGRLSVIVRTDPTRLVSTSAMARSLSPCWYTWFMGALKLVSLEEETPLDAYSRVVTEVARRLSPSVANLRVSRRIRGRRVQGGGSGVVITPDGFVLTSAHVVEGTEGGVASFMDGQELTVT